MPEYLAPGVYVEESSFRARVIDGVGTSTAGFVGPTRAGPPSGVPELITSFAEFERTYGGLDPLTFEGASAPTPNYLAHGVHAFFENGGRRLYVARIYHAGAAGDGIARATIGVASAGAGGSVTVAARHPGGAQLRVTFTIEFGRNVLTPSAGEGPRLRGVDEYDVLLITDPAPVGSMRGLHWVERLTTPSAAGDPRWIVRDTDAAGAETVEGDLAAGAEARPVTLSVDVSWLGPNGDVAREERWDGLGFHPEHRRAFTRVLGAVQDDRQHEPTVPVVLTPGTAGMSAVEIALGMLDAAPATTPPRGQFEPATATVLLSNGSDGALPNADAYAGERSGATATTGLCALEDLEEIAIIAAPGYSAGGGDTAAAHARMTAIARALIDHCERMRYRIAVLDSADGMEIADVRSFRAELDSSHAALYYPWVRVQDPVLASPVMLPPSGVVAGIYARNDTERGVHTAPANQIVRGAIGLERMLDKAQQDVLNPEGINALRWFQGRGYRAWGARTISADPEWKYVSVRRYFAYLERSIDRGTRWAVFEPNGARLWAGVRAMVEDFLYREWASGRLLGQTPQQAFFVRCDQSTMTQTDLDHGRLICLVGVAPLRPAEFVIFRIGQWTADRRP